MIILIPSYEPTQTLIQLITDLQTESDAKILVIDDGSGAKYRPIFRKARHMGCNIISHSHNLGKGQALKTGFKHLLMNNCKETIVCADSDGQHTPLDILRTVSMAKRDATMVLGVRSFTGHVPFRSQFGNKFSSALFQAAAGYKLSDTQTGLRAYSPDLLPWLLDVPGDRFEYELNLLLHAKKHEINIDTISIATIYEGNNSGSHFRPVKDSLLILAPMLRYVFSSASAGILDFFLLFLFEWLSGSLLIGVVLARIVSSVYNYTINSHYVFKGHNESHKRSALKYFSLVIIIMGLNYLSLYVMINWLYIPSFWAKLLTEILLFSLSYIIQKAIVFRRRQPHSKGMNYMS